MTMKVSEVTTMTIGVLRRQMGLSQFGLSLRARVHPSTISRIESGHYRPYPAEAKRLARALGVSAEDLFPVDVPAVSEERVAACP